MPVYGPNFPSTMADGANGNVAWTNPGNVGSINTTYATVSLLFGQFSNDLNTSGYGFAIPSNETVVGVICQVIKKRSTTGPSDTAVKLYKAGFSYGNNNSAQGAAYTSTDATSTYGSQTDLWGLTLSPADVNASGFGFEYTATCSGSATASLDAMFITVYTRPNSDLLLVGCGT